jgi:uncharacterized protein (TIGR03067 family)
MIGLRLGSARLLGHKNGLSRFHAGVIRPLRKFEIYQKSILPDGTVVGSGVNNGKPLGKIRIDPTSFPKTIDIIQPSGRVIEGIYDLDGDDLHICTAYAGFPRPSDFTLPGSSGNFFELFRRMKDKK